MNCTSRDNEDLGSRFISTTLHGSMPDIGCSSDNATYVTLSSITCYTWHGFTCLVRRLIDRCFLKTSHHSQSRLLKSFGSRFGSRSGPVPCKCEAGCFWTSSLSQHCDSWTSTDVLFFFLGRLRMGCSWRNQRDEYGVDVFQRAWYTRWARYRIESFRRTYMTGQSSTQGLC